MRKIAVLLLALFLLTTACALAFTGSNYPAWDGASTSKNSLCGNFGEEKLLLEFDPSQEYSIIEKGSIQACFFAFDSTQQNYLEMYLILPDSLQKGDTFNAHDGASNASISLYEVSRDTETLYFAGQVAGISYPQGSDYEIHIETASADGNSLHISGSLSAQLNRIDGASITDEFLHLSEVHFDFTMSANTAAPQNSAAPEPSATPKPTPEPRSSAQPEETTAPGDYTFPPFLMATPRPTMDPHPAFTLPPDYRVI